MNIETRLRTLEQSVNRHDGVCIVVVPDSGISADQTQTIRAAEADGRAVVLLSETDSRL